MLKTLVANAGHAKLKMVQLAANAVRQREVRGQTVVRHTSADLADEVRVRLAAGVVARRRQRIEARDDPQRIELVQNTIDRLARNGGNALLHHLPDAIDRGMASHHAPHGGEHGNPLRGAFEPALAAECRECLRRQLFDQVHRASCFWFDVNNCSIYLAWRQGGKCGGRRRGIGVIQLLF